MLDGRFKHVQDRFWDRLGHVVARTGITANQVTVAGTLLMAVHCLAYLVHRSDLWFGLGIALLELSDDLDGAVARVTHTSSAFGAYLDAFTDRYKELFVFAAIARVHDTPWLALACITGAMLTSYAKARAAMEKPLSNDGWPDLFERFERVALIVLGLVLSAFVHGPLAFGLTLLPLVLVVIAAGTHLTALQRFVRARALLR